MPTTPLAINQARTKVSPPGIYDPPLTCLPPTDVCHPPLMCHPRPHWHAPPPVHGDGGSEVPWPLGPNLQLTLFLRVFVLARFHGISLPSVSPRIYSLGCTENPRQWKRFPASEVTEMALASAPYLRQLGSLLLLLRCGFPCCLRDSNHTTTRSHLLNTGSAGQPAGFCAISCVKILPV